MTNKIPNEVIKIAKTMREDNPWKGSFGERVDKFKKAHRKMNKFYGKKVHLVIEMETALKRWSDSGNSKYMDLVFDKYIVLRGRLSVLTFFHEWSHAVNGSSEDIANAWSQAIFKQVFPAKAQKLKPEGTMLVREKVKKI